MIDLRDRATYIGASEVAALCGVSKFKTPVQLWQEKTGQAPRDEVTSEAARWGQRFERPILEAAIELLGLDPVDVTDANYNPNHPESVLDSALQVARESGKVLVIYNLRMQHPTVRFLAAEVDALLVFPDGSKWIIDAKRTGKADDWFPEGDDEPVAPIYYEPQFRIQMDTYKADAHFAAVLPSQTWGRGFFLCETKADADKTKILIQDVCEFWDRVKSGTAPDPLTYEEASIVWPANRAHYVAPTEYALEQIRKFEKAKADKKDAEARESDAKLKLAKIIGDAEGIAEVASFGKAAVLCSWKTQTSNRVDLKELRNRFPEAAAACTRPSSSRVMRVPAAAKAGAK